MKNKEYLSEEKYEKSKGKIKIVLFIIFLIGLSIGGGLIVTGLIKQGVLFPSYLENIKSSLEDEKNVLVGYKTELEEKIKPIEDEIKKLEREPFKGFDDAYYTRENKIKELNNSIRVERKNLSDIDAVLYDGDFHCSFSDHKNNSYTSKYCSINSQLKSSDGTELFTYYMMGGFVVFATLIITGSMYLNLIKGREITAYLAQQQMPLAKEGIEKMSPTTGKVAEEVTKGIKRGLKEENKED